MAAIPHYTLLSFDLDGTLVDTASEIAEAANRAPASHGITRRPAKEITHAASQRGALCPRRRLGRRCAGRPQCRHGRLGCALRLQRWCPDRRRPPRPSLQDPARSGRAWTAPPCPGCRSTLTSDGYLVKVLAWYDNEWGFSNRMLDSTVALAGAA